jgi:hypothetical protein
MATPLEIAAAHAAAQQKLNADIQVEALRIWRGLVRLGPGRLRQAWPDAQAELLVLLVAAQLAAAAKSDDYIAEVAAAQSIGVPPEGALAAEAVAAVASDGRPLETLLDQAALAVLAALASGLSRAQSFASGLATLAMILSTQIADAGRAGESVASTNLRLTGYVRMLTGATSCSRCVILAGRWYEWNEGFERHPDCDCIHIPAREDRAGDLRTDPDAYFRSLSADEQDRVFTNAGAQAIRDGADMNQVVNARSGMRTAQVFGRRTLTTTTGTTRRAQASRFIRVGGRPVRLMPETIYDIAESQEHALELLRIHGFII